LWRIGLLTTATALGNYIEPSIPTKVSAKTPAIYNPPEMHSKDGHPWPICSSKLPISLQKIKACMTSREEIMILVP
jgi:hypothetical protein